MQNNKGIGQYDIEYMQCPCFWGRIPGKFVKMIPDYLTKGDVLDIGAGEGKNSIYLAQLGFKVTAVEVSRYAVKNFNEISKTLASSVNNNINMFNIDALEFQPNQQYDLVVAYGFLHCLQSITLVDEMVRRIKNWVKVGGYVVVVSFNDDIGVPNVQDYLEPTLLSEDYLINVFKAWKVIKYENDIIEEAHPTSKTVHKHSLSRIFAQKDAI